ncbi:hypothetical protein Tco_1363577 [Tanacetum coccineum]
MQKHQFQQHTRTYHVPSLTMKVFSNMKKPTKGFSGQEVALFPTMLDDPEPSTSPSRITSSPSPSPTQPSPTQPSPTQPSSTQPGPEHQLTTPHDSPLHVVHLHGSDKGSLKLQELMNLVTTLSDMIGIMEARVPHLKIGKQGTQSRVVLSQMISLYEDYSSKQGEVIDESSRKSNEKASDEVSTAGAKKGTASEEVSKVKLLRKMTLGPMDQNMEIKTRSPLQKKSHFLKKKRLHVLKYSEEMEVQRIILSEMLEDFDRLDVEELFRLVKERYSTSRPEGFDLMLWGDLHTLFEPSEDDEIWRDHHEQKYPLSQEMLTKMLSRKLEVDHESSQVKMDDPNITMEEYIRLEEEKARRRGKVYNWETAMYAKICYDEDVYDLRSVETEFPAIVFKDALTFEVTLSCEPTVSPLNDNEINFRISFDESNDED